MAYNDKTEMPFGKFKGKCLQDVPAAYLMWWYHEPSRYGKNPELMAYIEENKAVLEMEVKASKK